MGGQPVITGVDLRSAGGVDGQPEFVPILFKPMGNTFILGPGVEGFGFGHIGGDAGIALEQEDFAVRFRRHFKTAPSR